MHRRASLLDVRAEYLAQRGMQQVRAGVVAADCVAALAVDDGVDAVAEGEWLLQHGFVRAHALYGSDAADDLGNGGVAVRGSEPARVADLAAGVGVEAGVIEDDFDFIAGGGSGNTCAVLDDGEHFAVGRSELLVAFEDGLRQIAKGRAGGFLRAAFPGGAGAGLLFGAGALETFMIEINAGVARRVHHEVERQTEGFVEMEKPSSRRVEDRLLASVRSILRRRCSLHRILQQSLPASRTFESSLPLRQLWRHATAESIRSGISALHLIAHGKDHLIQERLLLPKQAAMPDAAAKNLAQHVAAAFV